MQRRGEYGHTPEMKEKKYTKARWLLLLPVVMGIAAHFMKQAEGVEKVAPAESHEQGKKEAQTLRQAYRAKQALEALLAASRQDVLGAEQQEAGHSKEHFVNFSEVRVSAKDLLSFPVVDRLHPSPIMTDEEYVEISQTLDPDSHDGRDLSHWLTLQRTPGLFEAYAEYVEGIRVETDEDSLHIYHAKDETFEDMLLTASYSTSPNGAYRLAAISDREGDPGVYGAYEQEEYDPVLLSEEIKGQLQGMVIEHLNK